MGQIFLNLERQTWQAMTDPVTIGPIDPNAIFSENYHVAHLGQPDCLQLNLQGGTTSYSDVLWRYPGVTVLPQPASGLITFCGMLALSPSSLQGANAIEIDTMLSGQNILYNMSSQNSYAWSAGRLQVNNAAGGWVDTDINLGQYEPEMWHSFVWEYSWDSQRQICRKIAFTVDGMRYPIPSNLATIPGISQAWAAGLLLQLQLGSLQNTVPWSAWYTNLHLIYGRPIQDTISPLLYGG